MNFGRSSIRYGIAAPLALMIAGCTAIPTPEASPPPPAQAIVTPPPPTPPPALAWDERRLDSGAWRYDAATRTASFAPTGAAAPLLTLACRDGGIRLTAGLGAAAGQPLDVALKTSAGSDRLRFEGNSASLPARDDRLDKIAFSRGRFALEASNGSTLTLPVQSEIGRVIEDCRG